MALYRKYRPASFAEVVGQEHVTGPLSTALDAGRINHAYLFSGPRGCGKTSSARILARSLNCVQGPTANPCGQCPSCVALAPGGPGNLDVIELDAASHGGVDDTRELRDRAFYSPAESRYRVFIVDEAHMVTTQGFNALLKIVEEPPEHLIFIFATTEPEKVLPTIRSRTHHYPFRLLPPHTMRGLLHKICAEEQVTVEDAVFSLVIRAGGGSPRDSLSVLDQLIAGAEESGVTYAKALALLGVTDIALLEEAVDALAEGNGSGLFGVVDRVMESGHDPRRFATDLLERLRDLILLRAVPDAGERGLVDAPDDVLERMAAEAQRIGPATLTRYAELLHAGLTEMRGATAPRLLLEVICARMLLPSASDAESAALQRLERIERRLDTGDVAVAEPALRRQSTAAAEATAPPAVPRQEVQRPSAPPPAAEPGPASARPEPARAEPAKPRPEIKRPQAPEPVAVAPVPEPVAAASDRSGVDAVKAVWPKVAERVRERSRTVEVMLSGATIADVTDDMVVLNHESAPLAGRLMEPRNADVVRAALRDVLGPAADFRCVTGNPAPAPARPAQRAAPQTKKAADGPPRFARRSQGQQPAPRAPQQPADDIPPPPEPDDPEPPSDPMVTTPADEEEMIAESAQPVAPGSPRRDPDDVALELLKSELGARPIDG